MIVKNKRYTLLLGLFFSVLVTCTFPSKGNGTSTVSLPYQHSWLVVIGISQYEHFRIRNYALTDAKRIEETFSENGFDNIITLYDKEATKHAITAVLSTDLPARVKPDDRVVIFFAGRTHTQIVKEKETGYLIPVDAGKETVVKDSLSLVTIRSLISKIQARHQLLIIDSTVSGVALSGKGGVPYYNTSKKLKQVLQYTGVQVITAGRDFEPMDPYGSSRSVFAKVLQDGLTGGADKNRNGVITGNELGSYLKAKVSYESNNKQFPQYGRWQGNGEIAFTVSDQKQAEKLPDYSMVFVPGGVFEMGTPMMVARKEEKPLHSVYLEPFYIGKYEVMNEQYRVFLEETHHKVPAYIDSEGFNDPKQPISGVTWQDAFDFCRWLGKRLPTEAEWEKAARGAEWRKYPWGSGPPVENDLIRAAIMGEKEAPSLVGSYKAGRSPYGSFDMAGNVWEWVSDWYGREYYKVSPKKNPSGPEKPDEKGGKVLRGGSWNSSKFNARSSYRNWLNQETKYSDIGVRCAD